MSQKQRILIIENQLWQYNAMYEQLREHYAIFPGSNYPHFIDCVRVWANTTYAEQAREAAFLEIVQCIEENGIELILMDHKLGAAYYCGCGIDLATKINEHRQREGLEIMPVVFFSKTEHGQQRRVRRYNDYCDDFPDWSEWVAKGYYGTELFGEEFPDYVDRHLRPHINHFLGMHKARFEKAVADMLLLTPKPLNRERYNLLRKWSLRPFDTIPARLVAHIMQVKADSTSMDCLDNLDLNLLKQSIQP